MTLYNKYNSQGFEVLAFPCNQFGAQEPGSAAEIKKFAGNYGSNFPLFAKIEVNGDNAHPLYQWMKASAGGFLGDDIKWNFAKFLIGKDGKVLKRFAPTDSPLSMEKTITDAL